MKNVLWRLTVLTFLLLLTACSTTHKNIFPPTVSIQQLKVQANGHWAVTLRLLNNGYDSMRFQSVHLDWSINNQPAATINQTMDMKVPALSADIIHFEITPPASARKALQGIAGKGSMGALAYSLKGHVMAIIKKHKKARRYEAQGQDWLSAVPGIANTYR